MWTEGELVEGGGESVEMREGGVGGEGSGRKETDRSLVINSWNCRGLHNCSEYI